MQGACREIELERAPHPSSVSLAIRTKYTPLVRRAMGSGVLVRPGIIAINGSTGAAVVVVWVPIGLCPHVRLHNGAIAFGVAVDVNLSLSPRSND